MSAGDLKRTFSVGPRIRIEASTGAGDIVVSPGGRAAKVHARPSEAVVSDELAAELDAMWARTVGADLGFDTYEAFRRALPNPLNAARG